LSIELNSNQLYHKTNITLNFWIQNPFAGLPNTLLLRVWLQNLPHLTASRDDCPPRRGVYTYVCM